MEGLRALRFHQKHLNLCSEDERSQFQSRLKSLIGHSKLKERQRQSKAKVLTCFALVIVTFLFVSPLSSLSLLFVVLWATAFRVSVSSTESCKIHLNSSCCLSPL